MQMASHPTGYTKEPHRLQTSEPVERILHELPGKTRSNLPLLYATPVISSGVMVKFWSGATNWL